MARVTISEFAYLPVDQNGRPLPLPTLPTLVDQSFEYSTSTQSAPFSASTKYIRIIADSLIHFAGGENPVATADNLWLPAGTHEFFGVRQGDRLAAYDGSS